MMFFKSFRFQIFYRIVLLGLLVIVFTWLLQSGKYVSATLTFLIGVYLLFNLFHYVENTNRKLSRFIDAIRYNDFIIGFDADNKLGRSFHDLNRAIKEVLDAFRVTRQENEETLQFLDTLVKNVQVGIISYDHSEKVEIINASARKLLGVEEIKVLAELAKTDQSLYQAISAIPPGGNSLYRKSESLHLSIHTSRLRIRSRDLTLVSIQNIRSELQQNELEAWQNLTKVLRHEIMNSVTPISSLVSTLKDMFEEEMNERAGQPLSRETLSDINEALQAIENRSLALKKFVNAYREFTQIPRPELKSVHLKALFGRIENLLQAELKPGSISFSTSVVPEDLSLSIDEELIEMVLINLIKNAAEALRDQPGPAISLRAYLNRKLQPVIEVTDNGPGIIPEALDKIFIPFFTTKQGGSGIGLSLSRQIVHMHGGTLTVKSEAGVKTVFSITL